MYQKVIDYCKNNNISIMAFEAKCGLANGIVGRWKEESKPSLNTVIKIAKATGIPVEHWVSNLTSWDGD